MFKAVFLLAGRGRRLKPLTDETPKPLLEINGEILLERQVRFLREYGIDDVVCIVGYEPGRFYSFFKEKFADLNVKFIENKEFATTNNSYSLWHAHSAFSDEGMILLDGDIIYEKEILGKVLDTSPDENTLALRSKGELGEEEMKIILNTEGRITHISKELDPSDCAGESLGMLKFSAPLTGSLFSVMDHRMNKLKLRNEYYEASFQALVDTGEKIRTVDCGDLKCMEIDTYDDLLQARKTFRS